MQASFAAVLPPEVLAEVADRMTLSRLTPGRYLYEPELALVETGMLRAFVTDSGGRQVTVCYLRQGGAVGISHLLGRSYPAVFQAICDVGLARMDRQQVSELAERFPRLGWAVAEELHRRMDELLGEMARVAFAPPRQRAAFHLLALSDHDEPNANRVFVRQEDLALSLGVVRETIVRAVRSLRVAGLVETGPAGVTVVDRAGLQAVIDERI